MNFAFVRHGRLLSLLHGFFEEFVRFLASGYVTNAVVECFVALRLRDPSVLTRPICALGELLRAVLARLCGVPTTSGAT